MKTAKITLQTMQEYPRGARLHSGVGLSRSWFMVIGVYFMVLLLSQQLTNLTALFSQCCTSHSSSGTCFVLSHVSQIFLFWCSWQLIVAPFPASLGSVAASSDSSDVMWCLSVVRLCSLRLYIVKDFICSGLVIIPEQAGWVSLYIRAWVSLWTDQWISYF